MYVFDPSLNGMIIFDGSEQGLEGPNMAMALFGAIYYFGLYEIIHG